MWNRQLAVAVLSIGVFSFVQASDLQPSETAIQYELDVYALYKEKAEVVEVDGIRYIKDRTGLKGARMQKLDYSRFPGCEGLSTITMPGMRFSAKGRCLESMALHAESQQRIAKVQAEQQREADSRRPFWILGGIVFAAVWLWATRRNYSIWEARVKWADRYLKKS